MIRDNGIGVHVKFHYQFHDVGEQFSEQNSVIYNLYQLKILN